MRTSNGAVHMPATMNPHRSSSSVPLRLQAATPKAGLAAGPLSDTQPTRRDQQSHSCPPPERPQRPPRLSQSPTRGRALFGKRPAAAAAGPPKLPSRFQLPSLRAPQRRWKEGSHKGSSRTEERAASERRAPLPAYRARGYR